MEYIKTKKFLIEKLNEERKMLQDENAQIKKTLNDDRSRMQSRILTLEEENDKLHKELNKKQAQHSAKKIFESKMVEKVEELTGEIDDYKTQLAKAEAEIAKLKQSQDLAFRVTQERLLFTANEAEKFKKLGQDLVTEISGALRKASHDFEIENNFEKPRDVSGAGEDGVLKEFMIICPYHMDHMI